MMSSQSNTKSPNTIDRAFVASASVPVFCHCLSLRAQRDNPDKIIQKTIQPVIQQKDWIATLRSQ